MNIIVTIEKAEVLGSQLSKSAPLLYPSTIASPQNLTKRMIYRRHLIIENLKEYAD